MGKGVLLEGNGRQGIVLTPGGEIKRVRLRAPARVGEEVTYSEARIGPLWWVAAAAVIFMALAAPAFLTPVQVGPAVAAITLDINPSVEFLVDEGRRVVAIRALNADGAVLLKQVTKSLKGKNVDEAVALVTQLAIQAGKLQPADAEGLVLITVAPVDGTVTLRAEYRQTLADKAWGAAAWVVLEQNGGQAQVHSLEATAQERAAAEQAGVSIGKYLVYTSIIAEHPEARLTLDQVKDTPPGQLVRMFTPGRSVSEAMHEVHQQQEKQGKPETHGKKGEDKPKDKPPTPAAPGAPGQDKGQGQGQGQDRDKDKEKDKREVGIGPPEEPLTLTIPGVGQFEVRNPFAGNKGGKDGDKAPDRQQPPAGADDKGKGGQGGPPGQDKGDKDDNPNGKGRGQGQGNSGGAPGNQGSGRGSGRP